jgi:hypothetical protein
MLLDITAVRAGEGMLHLVRFQREWLIIGEQRPLRHVPMRFRLSLNWKPMPQKPDATTPCKCGGTKKISMIGSTRLEARVRHKWCANFRVFVTHSINPSVPP